MLTNCHNGMVCVGRHVIMITEQLTLTSLATACASTPPAGLEQAVAGKAPMRDEHLPQLDWVSMDTTSTVRPLETRLRGAATEKDGSCVAYVSPTPTFQSTVDTLLRPVIGLGDRYASRLYVFGPTGSGKSRFGWEVYQEVARRYRDKNVAYACCNLARLGEIRAATIDDVARRILRECARWQGSPVCEARGSSFSLGGVLRGWLGSQDSPTLLVLHLDEFQRQPQLVMEIQDVVEEINSDPTLRQGCAILPLCTGLFNKDFLREKAMDVSDSSHAIFLGYLSCADGSLDHDRTWTIVRNSVLAALGVDIALPESMSSAPTGLRYLVEDLCGWPMGAVQLGGQLAARHELQEAAKDGRPVDWERVSFGRCEAGLDEVLSRRYAYGELAPTAMFCHKLHSSGTFKLILLVLSPFEV